VFTNLFHFKEILHWIPQHRKPTQSSTEFLSWFLGFTEGDGSFVIDAKNKRLFFTITQRDESLLQNIRTELGFGLICNVNKFPEMKRYTVTHRSQIELLIHFFNGNLFLKKTTTRFSQWLEASNTLNGKALPLLSR
jgi:hypothetical protein